MKEKNLQKIVKVRMTGLKEVFNRPRVRRALKAIKARARNHQSKMKMTNGTKVSRVSLLDLKKKVKNKKKIFSLKAPEVNIKSKTFLKK